MKLLEEYLKGDTFAVYRKIEEMGSAAFEGETILDVQAVLRETMERVAYNLDIIYRALREVGYCFHADPRYDFEHPILKPGPEAASQIQELERVTASLGHLPLSLKMFYSVVGSCNFGWDYNTNPYIPWEYADPIQVNPLKGLLDEAMYLVEAGELDLEEPVGLAISADYYHKDNVSGGPPYSIELTAEEKVDSRFLNEEREGNFVQYLRSVMDGCGFSRDYAVEDAPGFVSFCEKVRPLLREI